MQLSPEQEQVLADLAGRLPNGKPKTRIVSPEEAVRPHGELRGRPKYIVPTTGEQMPFLILEQWYPPTMLGDKEAWDEDALGVFPENCSEDCCNNGFWGFRAVLHKDWQVISLSESLMDIIKARQFIDLEWAKLTDEQRLAFLDTERANVEKQKAEVAWERQNAMRDHYLNHKEEMDNADNRVYSWNDKLAPANKGNKEAIGSPIILL